MKIVMLPAMISRVLLPLVIASIAVVPALDTGAQGLGSEEHFVNVLRRSTNIAEPAAITYLVLGDQAVAFVLAPEATERLLSSSARTSLRQEGPLRLGEILVVDEAGVVDGGCVPIPIWLRWSRGRYELLALDDHGEVLAKVYPDIAETDRLFDIPPNIHLRDSQPNPEVPLSEKIEKLGKALIAIAEFLKSLGLSIKGEPTGTWTDWLNRDRPSGSGDFETLADFVARGQACATPLAVECRAADGRDWSETGQSYTCEQYLGGVCRNSDLTNGSCLDYQVRFLCAD